MWSKPGSNLRQLQEPEFKVLWSCFVEAYDQDGVMTWSELCGCCRSLPTMHTASARHSLVLTKANGDQVVMPDLLPGRFT